MMKKNQDQFHVSAMCEAFEVSSAGYYKSLKSGEGKRAKENQELLKDIKRIHQESRGTYGSPRVTEQLKREGQLRNRKRVAQLMSKHHIRGTQSRTKRVRTTQRDPLKEASDNHIKNKTPTGIDEIWVADITYLFLDDQGWIYLAAVMDLFSRKIVGWKTGRTMEATLVTGALENPLETRQIPSGNSFTIQTVELNIPAPYFVNCSKNTA